MAPVQQTSRATLGLHFSSPGVRPHHSQADAEGGDLDLARVAAAFRGFMETLGLDLDDANLVGTDRRVARAFREMFGGLRPGAEPKLSTFPNTERYAGIVSVTRIPFYSMCAHHFLPFFGSAHVGYVPGERLLGLSKMSRVVDFYARRPQLQERITEQVAALLEERLAPAGLIVMVEARHMCMEMRGVSRPGVTTTTTAVRGIMREKQLQRQFFEQSRGGTQSSGAEP